MRRRAALMGSAYHAVEFRLLQATQRKRSPPAPSAGTGKVESAQRLVSRFSPMTTRKRSPKLSRAPHAQAALEGWVI